MSPEPSLVRRTFRADMVPTCCEVKGVVAFKPRNWLLLYNNLGWLRGPATTETDIRSLLPFRGRRARVMPFRGHLGARATF